MEAAAAHCIDPEAIAQRAATTPHGYSTSVGPTGTYHNLRHRIRDGIDAGVIPRSSCPEHDDRSRLDGPPGAGGEQHCDELKLDAT